MSISFRLAPRRRPLSRVAAVAAAFGVVSLCTLAPGSAHAAAGPRNAGPRPVQSATHAAKRTSAPATFGIGPATKGKADRRPSLNYSVSPGAKLSDEVAVVNLGPTALTLSLYATDAVNDTHGAIAYQPESQPGNGARTWITLHIPGGATTLRVPAKHTTIVPIDVAVPTDATPGDHLAGITVSLTAHARTASGRNVDFDQGVALATHFRVSGDLAPALTVEHLTTSYHNTLNPVGTGHTTVSYVVHNTGNVTLGAAQRVTVSNLFGEKSPSATVADVPALLPGSSYLVTVQISGTYPAVWLTARVRLTPRATDTVVDAPIPAVDTSTGVLAMPWALIVAVAVLVLLLAAVLVRRRAHPRKEPRHQRRRIGAAVTVSGKV